MGQRTGYAPATFSWVELATTDPAAAKAFYVGLFGWELEDAAPGGGAVSAICRVGGDAVGGLSGLLGDPPADGTPPGWMSYVTVDDADATAARAPGLGGKVVRGPLDVPGSGRMAVVEDPQGAVLAVWQPRARIGAERVNDPGCLCMNELVTPDVDGARRFYSALFGWTVEEAGNPGGPRMVLNGDDVNAAIFAAPPATPAHWRACFAVASVEEAVARVRVLGGRAEGQLLDLGHGHLAIARDPQGAVFSIFAGDTDP